MFRQRIRKREAGSTKNKKSDQSFYNFVEEKLIQQGQALEHLVKMASNNEELTKTLIENLGTNIDKPKMPEKVEVHRKVRGSNESDDSPIVRLAKHVPQYGKLFKDMIESQARDDPEPVILVDNDSESKKLKARTV